MHPTIFHLISKEFSCRNVPYLLVGGFAVNYHKVTRLTVDIDLLIDKNDFDLAGRILECEGYRKGICHENFARFISNEHYMMDVDFLFTNSKTVSSLIKVGNGNEFIVPSLDHLISMKLHSLKHNRSKRMEKDLSDIIQLARNNKLDLRSDNYKSICTKYGTQDLYQKLLETLEN